jgi:hypothetical protein
MKVFSTHWIAGAKSDRVRQLRPVVCVDLGFSASKSSTGIAVLPTERNTPEPGRKFTFGAAINHVAQVMSASNEAVLFLEAPLSACFAADGNPCHREPFESQVIRGKRATRYWYMGAGATTMLEAIFFLRHLDRQLSELVNFRTKWGVFSTVRTVV